MEQVRGNCWTEGELYEGECVLEYRFSSSIGFYFVVVCVLTEIAIRFRLFQSSFLIKFANSVIEKKSASEVISNFKKGIKFSILVINVLKICVI